MLEPSHLIIPDWPAPKAVKSFISTRHGGISIGDYSALNLGDHVGDDPQAVSVNRSSLQACTGLSQEPLWLSQVHGTRVVDVAGSEPGEQADGCVAFGSSGICVVLTADCLPILLTDSAGTRVAALHAGWRGLADGIIEQGIKKLAVPGSELMAYLGPAIGPKAFEVGEEVLQQFCQHDPVAVKAFKPNGPEKWLADIYELARQRLTRLNIDRIYGGNRCTFTEAEDFYSYRRDGECGRMASMIWINGAQ